MKCCNTKGLFTNLLTIPVKKSRGQKKGAIPSVTEKLSEEAKKIGLTLNGLSNNKKMTYRNYTVNKCGHTLDLCTGNVRKIGKSSLNFDCVECYNECNEQVKNEKGLVFIKQYEGNAFSRPHTYSHFIIQKCGHEIILQTKQLKRTALRCKQCTENYNETLAEKRGLKYLGNAADKLLPNRFSNYKFESCGHIRDIDRTCVERNNFKCQECNSTFLTQKSNLYVYKITSDNFSFIKFGYGKNVENRIREYGLSNDCKAELVISCGVESGKIALKLEQTIHKEYLEYNLPHLEMKRYFRLTGHTECYPLEVKDAIINTIRNKVEELHGNKE
jgi:hypothetical protein